MRVRNKVVARGDVSLGDVWSEQVAPRHFNTVNVLFAGGHVQTMSPEKIDPSNTRSHDRYWRPLCDESR